MKGNPVETDIARLENSAHEEGNLSPAEEYLKAKRRRKARAGFAITCILLVELVVG